VQIDGDVQGKFHGQVGTVPFINHDHEVVVRPPDVMGLRAISVPQEDLRDLAQGALVTVPPASPKDADRTGVVADGIVDGSNGMRVEVEDGKTGVGTVVSVSVPEMTPQSRLWEIDLLPTPPRWNSEQELLFIDSARNHRHCKLHFPPTFGPGNAVWPLLIFMHGAGGGSLLDMVKKHFSSPGLEFRTSSSHRRDVSGSGRSCRSRES
jgi:hypothetical protein